MDPPEEPRKGSTMKLLACLLAAAVSASALEAPSLHGASLQAGRRVHLEWDNRDTGSQGFRVHRRIAPAEGFETLGTAPASARTFVDTAIAVKGGTYFYAVSAFAGAESSPRSNDLSVPIPSHAIVRNTEFDVAWDPATRTVTLTWPDSSNAEDGHRILRADGFAAEKQVADVPSPDPLAMGRLSYADKVEANRWYVYRVVAHGADAPSTGRIWDRTVFTLDLPVLIPDSIPFLRVEAKLGAVPVRHRRFAFRLGDTLLVDEASSPAGPSRIDISRPEKPVFRGYAPVTGYEVPAGIGVVGGSDLFLFQDGYVPRPSVPPLPGDGKPSVFIHRYRHSPAGLRRLSTLPVVPASSPPFFVEFTAVAHAAGGFLFDHTVSTGASFTRREFSVTRIGDSAFVQRRAALGPATRLLGEFGTLVFAHGSDPGGSILQIIEMVRGLDSLATYATRTVPPLAGFPFRVGGRYSVDTALAGRRQVILDTAASIAWAFSGELLEAFRYRMVPWAEARPGTGRKRLPGTMSVTQAIRPGDAVALYTLSGRRIRSWRHVSGPAEAGIPGNVPRGLYVLRWEARSGHDGRRVVITPP